MPAGQNSAPGCVLEELLGSAAVRNMTRALGLAVLVISRQSSVRFFVAHPILRIEQNIAIEALVGTFAPRCAVSEA